MVEKILDNIFLWAAIACAVAAIFLLVIKRWKKVEDWIKAWASIILLGVSAVVFFLSWSDQEGNDGIVPVQKGETITPEDLLTRVVNTLEFVDSIARNEVAFESAELTLNVKETKEKNGEVKLGVVKAGLGLENEDVLTITYELKDWLDAAKVERELLALLEVDSTRLPSAEIAIKWDSTKIKRGSWRPMPNIKWDSTNMRGKKKRPTPKFITTKPDTVIQNLRKTVRQIRVARGPKPSNEALETAIVGALENYKAMKKKFGNVCFDVEISFEVISKVQGEVEVEIVENVVGTSSSGSQSSAHQHSIKISFGKC